MQRRSSSRTLPSWTMPGARWRTWLYWPMLCIAIGLLTWRVTEGASRASIALSSCHVLVGYVFCSATGPLGANTRRYDKGCTGHSRWRALSRCWVTV